MTICTEYLKGNLADHAVEYRVDATRRTFQRHISQQDIECLLADGQVIERYDEEFPLPRVLLNTPRIARRPLHAVVGVKVVERKLVLITTSEPDPLQWTDHFSRRIV